MFHYTMYESWWQVVGWVGFGYVFKYFGQVLGNYTRGLLHVFPLLVKMWSACC